MSSTKELVTEMVVDILYKKREPSDDFFHLDNKTIQLSKVLFCSQEDQSHQQSRLRIKSSKRAGPENRPPRCLIKDHL